MAVNPQQTGGGRVAQRESGLPPIRGRDERSRLFGMPLASRVGVTSLSLMHRLRLPGFLLLAGLALAAPAASAAAAPLPADGWAGRSVAVEPARTSISVGTVTLTMPTFVRRGAVFESTYDCKVFPYFFANEHGTLRIDVTDADLDALQRGQPIDFRGQARSHRDAERAVEGRATPETPTEGRLKVRVRVSRRIELIFNTRYRWEPPAPAPRP
jgi:hypothetical protein